VGLDSVIGIVHAKEVMRAIADGEEPDLKKLARKPVFVSDTQPVSRLIFQLQRTRNHCCVVLDEHGTTIGLAFLEDALEEIVGPIQDEIDEIPEEVIRLASGSYTVPGGVALPEAADALELGDLTEEADTIGGYVVALLGRLPRRGDTLTIGRFRVTVTEVVRRRIERLRFDPIDADLEESP
jgi:CBS domain containing-hemolysin-like protein